VLVFATQRVWLKKNEWAHEQSSNTDWRGVVVFDANDLEHWVEIAPAVDVWFTRLTGRGSVGGA
jgi:hypothetical protein